MTELQDEQLKNPEHGDKKPLRIIHIEDQEEMRDLIGRKLRKFPDVELVASFSSTEEAKDYLMKLKNENKELPDGIVSDDNLGLGKATGIQFAKDLRELGFKIPVVLFTGDAQELKSGIPQEQFSQFGLKDIVDKYSRKPIEDLVGILKSIKPSQGKPQ